MAARVLVCRSFWSRLVGSAAPGLRSGDTLRFPSTRVIHTFFGRLPLEVRFLSASGETLRLIRSPRRGCVYGCLGAVSVEEVL